MDKKPTFKQIFLLLLLILVFPCYSKSIDSLNSMIWHNNIKGIKSILLSTPVVDSFDKNGIAPLSLASLLGNIDICRILLDKGANVDIADSQGKTPIIYAMMPRPFEPSTKIDKKILSENQYWHTQKNTICSLFIKSNSDYNHFDTAGFTILQYTVMYGYFDICAYLLRLGVPVNKKANNGNTALHLAVQRQSLQEKYINLLLKFGADSTIRDVYGKRPFDYRKSKPKAKRLSNSGCAQGCIYIDATGSQTFNNKCLLVIRSNTKDTTRIITDSLGCFLVCELPQGKYHLWASDSSGFKKKLILDSNGNYVTSDGGYKIPPFINKHIRDIDVRAGDTVSAGTLGLFYPKGMSPQKTK